MDRRSLVISCVVGIFLSGRALGLMPGQPATGVDVAGHYGVPDDGAPETLVSADLFNPLGKAQDHGDVIDVVVHGVALVDPDLQNERSAPHQGRLHYELDHETIVETTATRLGFYHLSPGTHHITVALVGNDHKPIGAAKDLAVTIPR
jgi:hypothetical protein